MNRYTKTKQKRELFLEVYKRNAGHISRSCEKAGINRQTFYNWMKKNKKFREKIMEINESFIDLAESVLIKKIAVEEDLKAIMYYLDNKGKHRGYGKSDVELSGNVNVNNKIEIIRVVKSKSEIKKDEE